MRHQRKALDHRSKEQNLRAGLLALTQQGVAYDIARDYLALRIQQHQCLHTLHRHLGSDYRDYAPNTDGMLCYLCVYVSLRVSH